MQLESLPFQAHARIVHHLTPCAMHALGSASRELRHIIHIVREYQRVVAEEEREEAERFGARLLRQYGATSSIILDGGTFNGISVSGRGVFANMHGETYAGQIRDGYACGLGVLDQGDSKVYADHGQDGNYTGRYVDRDDRRYVDRNRKQFACYIMFDGGAAAAAGPKEQAWVFPDGECNYNGEVCAQDDPRLLAVIAQVAPVEALANAAAVEALEAVEAVAQGVGGCLMRPCGL
jgi:hypothetical protein